MGDATAGPQPRRTGRARPVRVEVRDGEDGRTAVVGDLIVPDGAYAVVLFAHGSGSSRHSPRNQAVARRLVHSGVAALLVDLLTAEEQRRDRRTAVLRFDIALLARRLVDAVAMLEGPPESGALPLGIFGASTGAAAALVAAAERPARVRAVVSRGGRPDLASDRLGDVRAPTLLLVGGWDTEVLEMNRAAARAMTRADHRLEVVPGATHLFEEPGTLERVANEAAAWFAERLGGPEEQAAVGALPLE